MIKQQQLLTTEQEKVRDRLLAKQREKAAKREEEIKELSLVKLAEGAKQIEDANAKLREAEHAYEVQTANENAAVRALGDACANENATQGNEQTAASAERKSAQVRLRNEEKRTSWAQSDLTLAQQTHEWAINNFADLERGAALDLARREHAAEYDRKNREMQAAAGRARLEQESREYRKYVKLDRRTGAAPELCFNPNLGKPGPHFDMSPRDRVTDGITPDRFAARRNR